MNGSPRRIGATFVMLLVMAPALRAATWDEMTDGAADAGDRLSTAQVPLGSGALTTVTGVHTNTTEGDLYQIYLPNPADFIATTVDGGHHDTILYLFDTIGHVWVAQDDDAGQQSTIFFVPGQPTPPPGNFFLGVTVFDLHIRDANDVSLFSHPGYAEYTGNSPITGSSLTLWTNSTFEFDHFLYLGNATSGAYTIQLSNAEYMPEPGGAIMILTCVVAGLLTARHFGAPTNMTRTPPVESASEGHRTAEYRQCTWLASRTIYILVQSSSRA